MSRQRQRVNIPSEILRAVVKVAETESMTKASQILELSQPAISAQIKRIEAIVGGSIFRKTATGSVPTELGKLVLTHARRILEGNEQLLRLRGFSDNRRTVRLGINPQYLELAFLGCGRRHLSDTAIHAGNSAEIARGLLERHLDIGLLLVASDSLVDPSLQVISHRAEQLSWVRSPQFVLSPGAPIPVVVGAGQTADEIMVRALQKAGLAFRIALTSSDHHARTTVVEAGHAVTVLPRAVVPQHLICARDYYLPALETPKLFLCATEEMSLIDCQVLQDLDQHFFKAQAAQPIAPTGAARDANIAARSPDQLPGRARREPLATSGVFAVPAEPAARRLG